MSADCRPPEGPPDGEFSSFSQWVNSATSYIGGTNALCMDAKDRVCRNGGDFMCARDEGAFPVRFWFGLGGQTARQQAKDRTATRRIIGNFKFKVREALHGR